MPKVELAKAFQRHVAGPPEVVAGRTAREVLDAYFALHPEVRSYVLDERGVVRKHVALFVNDEQVTDRAELAVPVGDRDVLHVFQALSGG